jgi:hypothetical protein
MFRNTALERGTPEIRWPHINVKLANRKVLTAKNATEHRDLGTLDRILNANVKTRLR